jgi:WD40 repeat protein
MNIVTGGRDGTIKIWADYDLNEVATLSGHLDAVQSLAISSDGEKLASASHDKTIRIWSLSLKSELMTLHGHTQVVRSVNFTKNGEKLLSGSYEMVILWDVVVGRILFSVDGFYGLDCVRLCPDETLFTWSSKWSAFVQACNTLYGGEIAEFKCGNSVAVASVNDHCFNTNGDRLAAACGNPNSVICVWNVSTCNKVLLIFDDVPVTGIRYVPESSKLACACRGGRVKIIDTSENGQLILAFDAHLSRIAAMVLDEEGKKLVTGSYNCLKVFNSSTGENECEMSTLLHQICCMACISPTVILM